MADKLTIPANLEDIEILRRFINDLLTFLYSNPFIKDSGVLNDDLTNYLSGIIGSGSGSSGGSISDSTLTYITNSLTTLQNDVKKLKTKDNSLDAEIAAIQIAIDAINSNIDQLIPLIGSNILFHLKETGTGGSGFKYAFTNEHFYTLKSGVTKQYDLSFAYLKDLVYPSGTISTSYIKGYGDYLLVSQVISGQPRLLVYESGELLVTINDPHGSWSGAIPAFNDFAVIDDNIIIAQTNYNTGGTNHGRVYVFSLNTGDFIKTLEPADSSWSGNGGTITNFGRLIAVSGNTIAVAGYYTSTDVKMYLYDINTFYETVVTVPSSISGGDFTDLDAGDGYIVIGSSYEGLGVAFIYDELGTYITTINSPTGTYVDFGYTVATEKGKAYIEATYDDSSAGSLYVFDCATAIQLNKLQSPSGYQYGFWRPIVKNGIIYSTTYDMSWNELLSATSEYNLDYNTFMYGTFEQFANKGVANGYTPLDATALIPSDYLDAARLLAKILTVDGAGSLLDADFLDGQDGTYYLDWANFTNTPTTLAGYGIPASNVLAELLTVDGALSGLDADLLDGQHGTYYLAWSNFTGTPTTLAGYGITDAYTKTEVDNALALKLDASAYTAADVLAKLLTVDGIGSLLDADKLDGQDGTYYLSWANFTGTPTTIGGYGITDAYTKTEVDNALALKEDIANKGIANGYASLDGTGKVPSAQLPAYVDDVLEYPTYADLPATGTTGIIYIVVADETSGGNTSTYRWGGTAYAQISDTMSATDILNLLLTVDGAGSNLDADFLDGQNGTYYLDWANFTGTPTTIAGYGITDAYTKTEVDNALALKLDATAYTAADVLAKLLTVDGIGSLLDADKLDGQEGTYYLSWTNFTGTPTTLLGYGITDAYTKTETDTLLADKLDATAYTAADVLAKLLTVDGTGSLIDADKLDGLDSTQFMRSDIDNSLTTNFVTTGNVTAAFFYGDGSNLTNITAAAPTNVIVTDNGLSTHQEMQGGLYLNGSGNLDGSASSEAGVWDYGLTISAYNPAIKFIDKSTSGQSMALKFDQGTLYGYYDSTNDGSLGESGGSFSTAWSVNMSNYNFNIHGHIFLDNNKVLQAKETGGTSRYIAYIDTSNVVQLATSNNACKVNGTSVVVPDTFANTTGNWTAFVNDGGGNIGQRWNATPGSSNNLVENGSAWELEISNDSTTGSAIWRNGQGSTGTAGDSITWSNVLTLGYQGNVVVANNLVASGYLQSQNACTAWVSIYGIGTPTANDSFNVSSITDPGTGAYRINFATAMSNTNYTAHAENTNALGNNAQSQIGAASTGSAPTYYSTTQCQLVMSNGADAYQFNAVFFGGRAW